MCTQSCTEKLSLDKDSLTLLQKIHYLVSIRGTYSSYLKGSGVYYVSF